ncbi:protease HtpX [Alteromonas oceanisediminis]|uniref:protease HtpX n=1 Tax=Alteromonas oceanisediminis TaxID=2836180 RepID=UPI001BD9BDD2|nr:protease HtpX [Alteromonas oceanisediminis]MBT0586247.1 protease HtpX [Alteromonas oceanisediminis]
MLRVGLFIAVNIAILALLSITFRLLGIDGLLQENGVDLNLSALLIYSAVIGFSGSIISLLISKFMAKRTMGVYVIETPRNATEKWLLDRVSVLAKKAKIGMPEVGIFESPAANAFATGASKNNSLVAVSTGLLQQMTEDEAEAVLAHEIAHVANGDMITLTLVQGVVNTFVVFLSRVIGFIVDRVVFKVERGHGPAFFIVSLVAQVVLGFFATMIVMWFSRYREFRADAGGASLAGRNQMIAALQRLKSDNAPDKMPDEMAAFAISAGKVQKLFASHPPLEDRIAALKRPA